ncbi:MAG: deoxyribodipyrimidine photo-lyase [Burkholderiaceae bacterium]|jgi:deoxyribodipyrimidine photo-lyase
MTTEKGLVWLRRDLRLADHAALSLALSQCSTVWCTFIFDIDILEPLKSGGIRMDRRVEFIRECIIEVDRELRQLGGGLIVRHGRAEEIIVSLARALEVDAVFANHDYEPQALLRDQAVEKALAREDRGFTSCKDQVIFEKDELLTSQGSFYSVFTPYKRAWLARLTPDDIAERPTTTARTVLARVPPSLDEPITSLSDLGFAKTNLSQLAIRPGISGASHTFEEFLERLDVYRERRDFPAAKGPSYLSVHVRFGTISIRALVRAVVARLREGASPGAETWLSELIWREFYAQILYHRPDVTEHAFKPEYDQIVWEEGEKAESDFRAWCEGQTGYPIVDAAMRQINETGYMHNRLRMVVASFLTKDLGIDWRRGERYFAERLNDFDLASNNGGWQWAASSGCDAQPYFRIFNPTTQSEKFDPEGQFIRRYLPALRHLPSKAIHAPSALDATLQEQYDCRIGHDYPSPIVDHGLARLRTLERYRVVKGQARPTPKK